MPFLLLASSSPSRKETLKQTGVSFQCLSPDIDESLGNETSQEFVLRLSLEKAQAGWLKFIEKKPEFENKDFYVIGADQVAHFENRIFGKPKTKKTACEFLSLFSGKNLEYLSGMSIFHPRTQTHYSHCVKTTLTLKTLSASTIEHYVEQDNPLFCAGALKIESLGTALLADYSCTDPTAITGLPLITLNHLLSYYRLTLLDFTQRVHGQELEKVTEELE